MVGTLPGIGCPISFIIGDGVWCVPDAAFRIEVRSPRRGGRHIAPANQPVAGGHAMRCSVCGTESKSDAGFCASCGATLRPAAAGASAPAATQATENAPAVVPPGAVAPPPPRLVRAIGLILLVSAFGVAVYFTYRVLIVDRPTETAALDDNPKAVASEMPKAAAPTEERPAATDAAAAPGNAVADTSNTSPPALEPTSSAAPAAAPAPASGAESAAATSEAPAAGAPKADAAKARPPRPAPPSPAKGSPKAAAATPAAIAPPPAPAPVAAAPRPDRWELMKDELARCARDNVLSRLACEQRVGIRYCDGYWGKVPQCPARQQNPDK
jgi:hypothetical protein